MEGDDLLEVVKESISRSGVREICDRRPTWPGYDSSEKDTEENGATNTVHHEEKGENSGIPNQWNVDSTVQKPNSPSSKHAQPHSRIPKDSTFAIIGQSVLKV